ncbi:MAG: hypothetical protein WC058_06415 [Phycisphaeraceae bacterium]
MRITQSEIRNRKSEIALCLCASVVIFLIGCQPVKTEPAQPQAPMIPYAQLAERYNQRIALIDQISAQTSTTIRWIDDKGDTHFEQGDGVLRWRKPADLSFTIGALGDTKFQLGCNPRKWWMFNLSGDTHIAYRGDMDVPLDSRDRRVLPIPVRPDQLIRLLGVTPLDPAAHAAVESDAGQYRVTFPPEPALGNPRHRLWIDDQFRAVRIAWVNDHDQILAEAKLARFEPLKLQGHPPGAFPAVATVIELSLTESAVTLSLRLNEPTDGKLYNKINDAQFDFDILAKYYKIEQLRLVAPGTAPGSTEPPAPSKPGQSEFFPGASAAPGIPVPGTEPPAEPGP